MGLVEHNHEFIDLRAGKYYASISTYGGGPRALEYQGKPLLVDYPKGVNPPLSAGVVLAPWPNRVADGVFSHLGEFHRLEITEPTRANAIHGFAADAEWKIVDFNDSAVTLLTHFGHEPGWPWPLRCRITWTLDENDGLRGDIEVTNEANFSAPLGLGLHPYLSAAGSPLDQCTLTVPVTKNLPLDPVRNLPAGPLIPASRVVEGITEGISMDGVWLDHCFSAPLSKSASDSATMPHRTVQLVGPNGEGVEMRADADFSWFQVYTADPGRGEGFPGHGRAVAVEPMTCPPDALRNGIDLIQLAPHASFSTGFEFRFTTPEKLRANPTR